MNLNTTRLHRALTRITPAILFSTTLLLTNASRAEPAPATNHARNVILFIADGCGFNHLAAAGMYRTGKPDTLPFQSFPVRGAMSTFPAGGSYDPVALRTNFQALANRPTDSAAAATAMASGFKTRNGHLGVDPKGHRLTNIMERAKDVGKRTGVITSVPWSHATPAGFAAHDDSRGNYEAIASQMLFQSESDVIMGCGHPDATTITNSNTPSFWKRILQRWTKTSHALNTTSYAKNIPYDATTVGGTTTWNALRRHEVGNDADRDGQIDRWTLIEDRIDFQKLATATSAIPKRVLGTARNRTTLQEDRPGPTNAAPFETPFDPMVPTLAEMTLAAINVLANNTNGFVLMVEGGAVDWAAHGNNATRTIEEVLDFSTAIDATTNWIETSSSWSETVVIVTADHETGYLTGPGSGQKESGPVWTPLQSNGKRKIPEHQWNAVHHSNQLVPLYAKGAEAGRLLEQPAGTDPEHGIYVDNTRIAQFIMSVFR